MSAPAPAPAPGKLPGKPRRKRGHGTHVLAGPGRGMRSPGERDALRHTPADVAAARAEGYAAGVESYHAAVLAFFRRAWADYPIDAAAQATLRRALYTLAARELERAQTG